MEGREITTIEGIGDGAPDAVQEAFLDAGAVQCGYCTPGLVLSVRALLAENPAPGEAEVRRFLTGNICRCSGFAAIVRAAVAAGGER
ncbi:MAG: 2Fe-2S iron-sulfur cluster-binding protein [bacterium]|nr:2Fe-2S iron-sulfur cluster-binding protein [bacterium]MCY4103649.1 2Fe-2S iron-sulfur cluster-binding protein [bacterium]